MHVESQSTMVELTLRKVQSRERVDLLANIDARTHGRSTRFWAIALSAIPHLFHSNN